MINQMQIAMPTAEEVERLHAGVLEDNTRKERARVAAANRKKGFPEPQPGDRLFVTSGRGIKQRSRAGIAFGEQQPTEVHVIGEFDERPAGVKSATVHEAETILNDSALNVRGRNATDAEAADLRRQVADRDSEIEKLKSENARIIREARMAAKDDPNGGPSRLRAARQAKDKLGDPDGFGGKD